MKKILFMVIALMIIPIISNAQVTIGSDNSSNYTMNDYPNEGNLGFGFNSWYSNNSVDNDNNNTGGWFRGDPTSHAPNLSGMVQSSTAFGIWADGFSDVGRNFNSLENNSTLKFLLGFQWDNGNRGFSLYTGSVPNNEVFNFNINSTTGYTWTGGGSQPMTPWDTPPGDRQNGVLIEFSITQTSSGLDYSFQVLSGDTGFGTKTGSVSFTGRLNGLKFYVSGAGGGDGANLYFNNLSIETPGTVSLADFKGFRMLASPVNTTAADLLAELWTQGQTAGGDTDQGGSNVWTWDKTASGYATTNWQPITNLTTTTLSGASGILVYDYDNDDFSGGQDNAITTLSVTGTEKAAPGVVSVNTNGDGYTLLGNPFATSIAWDQITKTDVYTTAHVWNPTGNNAGSWTNIAGSDKIAPFQGFLVRTVSTPNSPSIEITNAAKTTGATFLGKQALVNEIKFDFNSGETFTKSVRIQIHADASEGKDFRDAERLAPLAVNYLDAYFSLNDMAFTIISLPELTQAVTIPLHIEFTQSGTVELRISSFNLPTGYQAMLVDELTGSKYELSGEFTYSFEHVVANKSIAKSPEDVVKSPLLAGVTSTNRFSVIVGPITTSVRELSELPKAVILHQNYPNPFNPSTQISFELPQAMHVKLTVFDMLGREIATLLNGSAKAGYNSVSWNAANASSGIYYYRLQAGNTVVTKKMTMIK